MKLAIWIGALIFCIAVWYGLGLMVSQEIDTGLATFGIPR